MCGCACVLLISETSKLFSFCKKIRQMNLLRNLHQNVFFYKKKSFGSFAIYIFKQLLLHLYAVWFCSKKQSHIVTSTSNFWLSKRYWIKENLLVIKTSRNQHKNGENSRIPRKMWPHFFLFYLKRFNLYTFYNNFG